MIVTDSSGNTETIPVTPADPPPVPDDGEIQTQSGSLLAEGGRHPSLIISGHEEFINLGTNFGTIVLTLQGFSSGNSFQLVERPYVANGLPDKIIVESGP